MDEVSNDQFIDTQDIAQDISAIYNTFVNEINQHRSQSNAPEQVLFTKFDDETINRVTHSGLVSRSPQESFCNTFYRLLGLPIISSAGVYSPGYNPNFKTDKAKRDKFNTIASAISRNIYQLLDEREKFPLGRLKNYASGGYTATAQAMSLQYLRPISLLDDGDNDPLSPDKQQYNSPQRSEVKKFFKNIEISADLSDIKHIVKPFIVDPRIDLLVQPVRNRIAAPFLSSVDREIGNGQGQKYRAPLIEKVCRIRFNVQNNEEKLPQIEKIIEILKEDKELADESMLELAGGGISNFYRAAAYVRVHMAKTMRVVIDKLTESVKELREVQNHIIWLPKPNVNGIDAGISTHDIPAGFRRPDGSRPELDEKIEFITHRKIIAETEFESFRDQLGDTDFSEIDSVAFGAALSNIPKNLESKLAELANRRHELEKRAEEALYNIAIIMGDDTGFGLLDMIVVYTALWTVDKSILVDMLDNDAFARMAKDNSLRSAEVVQRSGNGNSPLKTNATDILKAFETQVKLLYSLAETLFDINSISSRS